MAREVEIVVTGLGVVSPIGIEKTPFWNSLVEGKSGVQRITAFDASAMPVQIGAQITDFNPKAYVKPRKSLKVMCREVQTGFSAGAIAMADGGLESGSVDPERLGVVYGSEMFYGDPKELRKAFLPCRNDDGQFEIGLWGTLGMAKLNPLWMLMYLPNMVACHLGIAFDGRGPNNTITVGDASGLLAVIEAAEVLSRGQADCMLAGGVGTRINLSSILHRTTTYLSHRNEDPQGACRPFDKDRDGTVAGEGAGAVLLETREHAERRGANIYASLAGWGRAFESFTAGGPFLGSGIQAAIHSALANSGTDSSQVNHVNAHGLGTREGDQAEARAIQAELGSTPVTALKSYFGNLGTGSGIVELVGTVLSMDHDYVPPTLNYTTPDPDCPLEVVAGGALESQQQVAMAISYSGTGQAASVLLRKD